MDISPAGLARNCIPNLPRVIKTSALSLIGQSPNSKHQDTLTETIVTSARPILQTPASLLKSQIDCNTDWGIGRPWIAKYTIPASPEGNSATAFQPDDSRLLSIKQAIQFAIKKLGRSEHHAATAACVVTKQVNVDTEWTFCPPHTLPLAPHPDISEQQVYKNLMRDVDPKGPTILHFHGGAFCLMDPSTHRWTMSSLARHASGRVMSVRYRLAPQNIFPAALVDALQAYLALLSPPATAFHEAVPASKIVISGDSSGGGLAASLLLLLVTLSRDAISIRFHGKYVRIPSPPCAGCSLASPWLDLTRSLPSTTQNARYDIIAPPPLDSSTPPFPVDAIWPTSPPRAETYTNANMTTHPLVSPLASKPSHWEGTPPVYLCTGWESFTDEIEVFARKVYSSSPSARVAFEGWEGMPHCFMMIPWNRAGRTAQSNWGRFCREAVTVDENGKSEIKRVETGTWTSSLNPQQSRSVKLAELGLSSSGSGYVREQPLDDITVDEMMDKGRSWRVVLEEDMVRRWKEGRQP